MFAFEPVCDESEESTFGARPTRGMERGLMRTDSRPIRPPDAHRPSCPSVTSDYGSSEASMSSSSLINRSLVSLLSSLNCVDTDSLQQLERENSHFSISESLIETFEQMKCDSGETWRQRRGAPDGAEAEPSGPPEDAPEEQQWIRVRRRKRRETHEDGLMSPSTSCSSLDHLNECGFDMDKKQLEEEMEEDIDDDQEQVQNLDSFETSGRLSSIRESGISLSNTSLLSMDAVTPKSRGLSLESNSSMAIESLVKDTSAESIAFNLLKRFSLIQPLNASDLHWMVTDTDNVPQSLLPLPQSKPVSPDEVEEEERKGKRVLRMRGTLQWAPPRPQVIFTIHPPPNKKIQIAKQNFICAGCGYKIDRKYIPRMLYCHYTGRYFCQYSCHSGKRSIVPGYIINKWDFRSYPVSNFAYQLIDRLKSEPVFNLQDLSAGSIYKRTRTLARVRELRSQLVSLKEYIYSCKRGGNVLLNYLIFEPKHFANADNIHIYSLEDLIVVKTDGKLIDRLLDLVKSSIKHVSGCSSCRAKGFVCEVCSRGRDKTEVIFPFELGRVVQCSSCNSCYHSKCFTLLVNCSKCERIRKRRVSLSVRAEDKM